MTKHTAQWLKRHGFTNGLWRLEERANAAKLASARGIQPMPASDRPMAIRGAIARLREVRDRLREAEAHRSADYVARALKSVEGALRHAQGRASR